MKNIIRHIHPVALSTSVQPAFARPSAALKSHAIGRAEVCSGVDMVVIGYGAANHALSMIASTEKDIR